MLLILFKLDRSCIMTLKFGFSPCKLCQLCWRPNLVSADILFPTATKQRVACVCGMWWGSVCLLALSTKARWKIAWSYKQQIGNLIKIWCAQTRAYHCFSCVNLGFLGCHLRVFFSFKVSFFLNHFISFVLVGSMNTSGLWFQNC